MIVLLKIPENAIHVNSRSSQIQKFRQPTIFQINFRLALGSIFIFCSNLKQRAFCDTPARQGYRRLYAYIRSSLQNAVHFCRVQVFLQSHSTVVGTQKTQPSFWTSNERSSDTHLRFRFNVKKNVKV